VHAGGVPHFGANHGRVEQQVAVDRAQFAHEQVQRRWAHLEEFAIAHAEAHARLPPKLADVGRIERGAAGMAIG
jgi:hypothetical protein